MYKVLAWKFSAKIGLWKNLLSSVKKKILSPLFPGDRTKLCLVHRMAQPWPTRLVPNYTCQPWNMGFEVFFPGFPVTVSKCLRRGGLFCLAFYFCLVVMITYILFMTLAHTGDTRIPPKLDEDYSTQTRWTIFPLSGFFLTFRTLSRSKMSLTLPYQSQDL